MRQSPRSAAEWVTLTGASSILFMLLGLVGYSWLTTPQKPASVNARYSTNIREENGQFYVPYEVVNTGGETVEAVQIIAELRVNGQLEETGEQQIDFLSRNEKENGAFVFSRDPRQGEMTIRIASYKQP